MEKRMILKILKNILRPVQLSGFPQIYSKGGREAALALDPWSMGG
jgi:hypothetical protein